MLHQFRAGGFVCRVLFGTVLALAGMTSVSAALAGERMMIVLDASGSMWGQIDGVAKISIARDVLSEVLGDVDPDLEMGLMAYGHRQKGQCSDIQTVVPIAPGTGVEIGTAAQTLNPLGKTPLSDAVQMAAEELRYTEARATVVLITDGIETCEADPCALARALEESGVDFTTHVVGFGLSAEEGQQVACLAAETGGQYLQANDADGLAEVLTETVSEVAEGETPELDASPETVAPEPVELPEVAITVPETVVIGSRFDVVWDGPEPHHRDALEIYVSEAEADPASKRGGRRVVNGDVAEQSVELIAPITPGFYDVRYFFGEGRHVVAEARFEAIESLATLDAPATTDIGRPITVVWDGPGTDQDYVYLVDPRGSAEGERLRGRRVVNDDFANRTVTLDAPAEPGFYELWYWNNRDREILAVRQIEILDAEVSLDAPDEVPMATRFDVAWVGPGDNRDYVEIVDSAGEVLESRRLANGDFANRIIDLMAPAEPGDYELRYFNGQNTAVLATRPITVVELAVALNAPESVGMGGTATVGWQGPGARRDTVAIWDLGIDRQFHAVRVLNGDMAAQTVDIRVPVVPGTYELRYISGETGSVLATRPLEIVPVDVSLEAPARVGVGEAFEVTWSGPGAARDAVQLFDPQARGGEGFPVDSKRVTSGSGSTVTMRPVETPGMYQLRYWNQDNGVSLFEVDIVVE